MAVLVLTLVGAWGAPPAGATGTWWWERTFTDGRGPDHDADLAEAKHTCELVHEQPFAEHEVPGAPRYAVIGDSVPLATRAFALEDPEISWVFSAHCGEKFGTSLSSGRLAQALSREPDVLAFGFGTNSGSFWFPDPSLLPQAEHDFEALLDASDGVPCRVIFNLPEVVPPWWDETNGALVTIVQRTINGWMANIDPAEHPGVTVVDWNAETRARPDLIWDEQHLTHRGIDARMNLTLGRTRQCLAPDVPEAPQAVAGNGSATVWWPPLPPEEGVTTYTVTSSLGHQVQTTSPIVNVGGLTNDTPVSFTVRAENSAGSSAPSAASATVVPDGTGARFHATAPVRVFDTRAGGGPVAAGTTRSFSLAGPVPADATAVVLNVTATGQTTPTFVTAWPGGRSRPMVSNLNPRPDVAAVAAMVTTPLGPGRTVQLYNNSGSVHLIADVVGWYSPSATGSLYRPETPRRILDSRDGTGGRIGIFGNQDQHTFTIPDLPPGTTAAVVNITSTNTTAAGFVTIYPGGGSAPEASNLNPQRGMARANTTVTAVNPAGKVTIYNNTGATHLVVDLMGTYGPEGGAGGGSEFFPITPERLVDTRDGTGGVDGPVTGAVPTALTLAGHGSLPAAGSVRAVTATLTIVDPVQLGHATMWPDGALPPTSSVNYRAHEPIPNAVVAPLAGGATLVQSTSPLVNYVLDVSGWFGPELPAS